MWCVMRFLVPSLCLGVGSTIAFAVVSFCCSVKGVSNIAYVFGLVKVESVRVDSCCMVLVR